MMMKTQIAMMDEALTEHQLKMIGYDLEEMRTHQIHENSETKIMAGIKITSHIQLNV